MAVDVKLDKLFTPDAETAEHFSKQVRAVLNGVRLSDSINMGRLPAVYSVIGIVDENLKTNASTILKAVGLKGQNKHHVQSKTLENLLALVHDPEGVFKSLDNSQDPNSYVAVLNAKSDDGKQIIAVLRPDKEGKSVTFIPSVYERDNFDWFVEQSMKENKVVYVKEKGSELWGRLQLPPHHSPKPYDIPLNNILTKENIVKRYAQALEKN